MTTMIGARPAQSSGKARLIAACTIGNALEFYDFVIYSFFAATIGALFFPAESPTVQLLLSLATYGVGFFLRPLGGVVLGRYADRRGRKAATILTLFLMALGTAMIGLAPTYAQIGIFAPVLVVLGRLLQGFSAGGECGDRALHVHLCHPPAWHGTDHGAFGRDHRRLHDLCRLAALRGSDGPDRTQEGDRRGLSGAGDPDLSGL